MRVDDHVLTILSRAETTGRALVLPGQLDRKDYVRVNKVLEAAGGKWASRNKAHLFDGSAADAIEQILLTGEIARPQDFGEFFSPAPVADRVIELARLKPGMDFLEPSAGRGALSSRALLAGCNVDCVETQERHVNILCSSPYRQVVHADFLTLEPVRRYSRIGMNPPFARQADIDHVLHALRFLEPGGLLVSVMAASVVWRDNQKTRDFRDLIGSRGGEIEALPEGAFRESGTMVRTVIVMIPEGRA